MGDAVARSVLGGITYLAPADSLALEPIQTALSEAIRSCIESSRIQLVLDLDRVSLANGRAMEIMFDASTQLARLGGGLRFVNASPLLLDIFVANGVIDSESVSDQGSDAVYSIGERHQRSHPGKLGELALAMGLVTEKQLSEAKELQKRSRKRLGQIMLEREILSETDLSKVLSRQMGIPYILLRPGLYEAAATSLIPVETARRLNVLPMFKVHNTLTLATSDPHAIFAFDEIQDITGCKLRWVLARGEEISKSLSDAYGEGGIGIAVVDNLPADLELVEQAQPDLNAIDEMAEASPVINLVNGLIQRAVRERASDIHIECLRNKSMVRFRIDGVLYEILTLRLDLHPAIVSRLKVMGNLDIAERRMPQDGRMQVVTQGRSVDLRFSSLPGIYGEKVVLRVLDKNQSILDVEKIGMSPPNLALFKKLLDRSYGLILVTGPTGSGKTTTLYAATNYLKSVEKNIVTIEDPVEYQLDIINQNQVNEAIGLGFAKVLRHVLRQDPDIIMVGEIRDRETAEIAVQAALTGHVVLSTLHTNNAVGAISRMIEMGIAPYLLSSALAGVVGQRLVRQVCQSCKTNYLPSPELAAAHGWASTVQLAKGRGCPACLDSGYRGRAGIYEILESTEDLQRLMMKGPSKDELQAFVKAAGCKTLFEDGLQRVIEGRTTLEEVARVIHAT